MRRNVQVLGWTLIWSGLFIFGYLGWQLFGTDLVNEGVQAEAAEELEESLAEAPPPEVEQVDVIEFVGTSNTVPQAVPDTVELFTEGEPTQGDPFAFLRIPKLAVDEVLFEGVDRRTLKNGPGHMEDTPLPGQPGNAVVSGHRTTYGRPFFDFDLLVEGDEIEVETGVGVHTYAVREILIVEPTDIWVTDARAGGWLTLTTCHPKFSARKRLVVFAEMTGGPNYNFVQLHELKFGDSP